MTWIVIGNIVLMAAIVVGIVGMLAAAIHTSRPETEPVPVARRAARQRRAPAQAYRSYEGLNA